MTTDQIPVFGPGEHFVTRDVSKETRLWRVDERGLTKIIGWGDHVQHEEQELLSVRSAAHALNVSERTIWAWIKADKLNSVKVGPARRIAREELERLRGAL